MINFRIATLLIAVLICMKSGYAFEDVIQADTIDVESNMKEFEENQARCMDNKILSDKAIERLIKKSNFCKRDSDCTSLYTGYTGSSFGCTNIPLNKNQESLVSEAIYKNGCIEYGGCGLRDLNYCRKVTTPVFCSRGMCKYK